MKNTCLDYFQASRLQSQPKQMLNLKSSELPASQRRLPETPASKDGVLRRASKIASSGGVRTLDQDILPASTFVWGLTLNLISNRSKYTSMAETKHRTNLRLPQACPVLMDNYQSDFGECSTSSQMVCFSDDRSTSANQIVRTDEGQASLIKAFETSKGPDKDRCLVAKDLQLSSVNTL